MASLCLLLLSASLMHSVQSLPAARGGGRGFDDSVGGARRVRRDLGVLLPYEAQMMSYPVGRGGGGNDVYYQSDGWRGRGLDQALQRLMESDQRRERQEEENEAAYLAAMLHLLSEAESTGLVSPGDVDVVEEGEEEGEEQSPGDFQGLVPPDYDETGRGMSMGKAQTTWWGMLEPQLARVLLERLEPQIAQALLERARQERLQQAGRPVPALPGRPGPGLSGRPGTGLSGRPGTGLTTGIDQENLRYLVAKILSSIGPSNPPVSSSSHRARRDLSVPSPAHRRTRRSLEDMVPPLPSNDPPLLRVKRLELEEEEEEEGMVGGGGEERYRKSFPHQGQAAGLQRMKRIDVMATAAEEELNHGSRRRRRRAAANYDPQVLVQHILQYLQE